MKSRLMATSVALALFSIPATVAYAQQNEIVVAQAEDAEVTAKFNELIADQRPASDLTDKELKARLTLIQTLLSKKSLAKPKTQQVRKIAKEARDENKKRRQAKQQAAKSEDTAEAPEATTEQKTPEADTTQKKAEEPAATDAANTAGADASQAEVAQVAPDPKLETQAKQFLAETAEVDKLSEADLRRYIKQGRRLLQNGATPKSVLPDLRERNRALRTALQGGGNANEQNQTTSDQQQPATGDATAQAQKVMGDVRPATDLSQTELQERLQSTRQVLSGKDLPASTVKQLRLKLAQDRTELRRRMAAEQVKGPDGTGGQGKDKDKSVPLQSDDFYLKDSRRAVALNNPELERRVLVMRVAAIDTRYPLVQRNRWREQIDIDRAELRRRALDDRRRREAEWRHRRDSGNLNIAININIDFGDDGRGRPRPIYLAEANDEDVERYLVAAPVRPPARRYTMDEVRTMPEVRQTMPAVEIDTIKFGFNEDFVREEALEDLDRVGEAIERVLAAHPGEVFLVEGHTDAVGSDSYNLDLSMRRAESVKQALVTYYNIDAKNIATAGYGEEFLRIQTEEEEEENRRVTMRRATPLVGEAN